MKVRQQVKVVSGVGERPEVEGVVAKQQRKDGNGTVHKITFWLTSLFAAGLAEVTLETDDDDVIGADDDVMGPEIDNIRHKY